MLVKEGFSFKKPPKGDVAIEIEYQGRNLPLLEGPWYTKNDGSLKGQGEGKEYIIIEPSSLDKISEALSYMEDSFDLNNTEIYDSFYAGTHVHINVQTLSFRELLNFICAYLILEETLVDWCGKERVGNHFCLRAIDADWIINYIVNMITKENIKYFDNMENLKYGSMNIHAVKKFGSLEFRSLNSTTDKNRMLTWCRTLLRLRDESIKYRNPKEMIINLSAGGYENFARRMLGPDFNTFCNNKNWHEQMRRGIINAQEIAFAKDWENFNFNIFMQSKEVF